MRERRANQRIRLLLICFGALFAVVIGRAAYVQAVQHDRFAKMATTQHRETIEIPAGRGTIYDRTGEPLAIGEQATTVYANPHNVTDAQKAAIVVGKALGLDPVTLYPVLKDRSKGFVYVARKASPASADALRKREIPGVGFYPEELRTYPQGNVASHVLGFAGTDNHGLDGLERSLDKMLAGKAGFETIVKDPFGRAIDVVTSRAEQPGHNVTLTIDHQIQANAEQVIERYVNQFGARGAAAIVMDPRTGAILAMANYPSFDANHFSTASPDARRNRAVTDAYEPGSTFKIVTIAGALEDNVVSPTTTFTLAPTIQVA
ncbi:MAG: penicillin-binding protein 2, partial [Thermoleophilia bacterium]|nr:penicillin-binding protein 2 [Thermoleophilia bacterium]